MIRFLLPLLLLVSFSANANVYVDGETIFIEGYISPTDAHTITSLDPNKIKLVTLDSPGGNYEASKEIAFWVRHNDIATKLYGHVGCYSGCSLIFQSGYPKRYATTNSILGYHPVRIEVAANPDEIFWFTNPGSTKEIKELYRAYGMTKECVDKIPSLKWDAWFTETAKNLTNCNVVTDYIEAPDEITFSVTAVTRSEPGTLSHRDPE